MNDNKIIAEFMGMKPHHQDSGCLIRVDDNGSNEVVPIEELAYHVSWNWLMPVVEKIEELGYDTELVYRLDDGEHCFYINDSPIFSSQMGCKKEATYLTVVEFIKWYNGLGS